MKKLAVVLCAVALAACDAAIQSPSKETLKRLTQGMSYVQDSRTHICYSVISTGHVDEFTNSAISYSYVPCEGIPPKLLVTY